MSKLGTGIISGAYGRDYKSAAAMPRDFTPVKTLYYITTTK